MALSSVNDVRLRDHFMFFGAIRFFNLAGFLAGQGMDRLLCRLFAFFHREVHSAHIWHGGVALGRLFHGLGILLVFT